MMGCLTAPFRAFGCLLILALAAAGWFYRDRLFKEVQTRIGLETSPSQKDERMGRPGSRALASARNKIDSLNGWRADSVTLTPSEVASLIGSALAPALRGRLDSLHVRPRSGELVVGARLKTEGLPKDLIGPMAIVLRPREAVEASGSVEVVRSGYAEWAVDGFSIRGIPLPPPVVPRLVERAFAQTHRRTVPLRIPEGIRRIRFSHFGAVVYGGAR